jgi:hypothetical protein
MRLAPPNRPRDIDVGDVVFTVIPGSQYLRDLAATRGQKVAREMMASADLWKSYGLEAINRSDIFAMPDADALDALAEEAGEAGDMLTGYGLHIYAVELAVLCVKGWKAAEEGGTLVGEDGRPAAVNRRNLSLLFQDTIPGETRTYAVAFIARLHQETSTERAEGKP